MHSVGIRPGVVYGVGRDQGMTSKTTVALLAAAANQAYDIPFSGHVSWLFAAEAASAFIRSVAKERVGAPVFDLNGVYASVEEGMAILKTIAPDAQVGIKGEPLAFPMDKSDEPLKAFIGDYGQMPLAQGIEATYKAFAHLLQDKRLSASAIA